MSRRCCGLWFSLGLCLALAMIALAVRADAELGKPLPAFDSVLLDGTTLRGEQFAGRPLLVVFWATWCPLCRKELPHIEQLYQRHKARGFEVLAVSIDAERLEVDEFLRDHKYGFPVAMRSERHSHIFGVTKTPPRLFLVDRQGVLRFKHLGAVGPDKLEAQLLPLL
jgi:thiol-disulfide isomerase/thioredoxin